MFEGDSVDMCAEKFPLVSMAGRAEGLACADQGVRTPIGASRISVNFISLVTGPAYCASNMWDVGGPCPISGQFLGTSLVYTGQ